MRHTLRSMLMLGVAWCEGAAPYLAAPLDVNLKLHLDGYFFMLEQAMSR